jgi:hypothetical protein
VSFDVSELVKRINRAERAYIIAKRQVIPTLSAPPRAGVNSRSSGPHIADLKRKFEEPAMKGMTMR